VIREVGLTRFAVELLLGQDDLDAGHVRSVGDGVVQDADSTNDSSSVAGALLVFYVGGVADY